MTCDLNVRLLNSSHIFDCFPGKLGLQHMTCDQNIGLKISCHIYKCFPTQLGFVHMSCDQNIGLKISCHIFECFPAKLVFLTIVWLFVLSAITEIILAVSSTTGPKLWNASKLEALIFARTKYGLWTRIIRKVKIKGKALYINIICCCLFSKLNLTLLSQNCEGLQICGHRWPRSCQLL